MMIASIISLHYSHFQFNNSKAK